MVNSFKQILQSELVKLGANNGEIRIIVKTCIEQGRCPEKYGFIKTIEEFAAWELNLLRSISSEEDLF